MDHIFVAHAMPDAQMPLRVLGLFAQQDILPHSLEMTAEGDAMRLRIAASGLPAERAAIIAEKLRAMVMVRNVTHSTG